MSLFRSASRPLALCRGRLLLSGVHSLRNQFPNRDSMKSLVSSSPDFPHRVSGFPSRLCSTAAWKAPASDPTPGQAAEAPAKKAVCDPYGQDGKYLELDIVKEQMNQLHRGWRYDEQTRRLERVFVVCSPSDNPTQRQKAERAYRFTHLVGVISDNLAHQVYGLQIKPRAGQVTIQLRTIPLRGLSYNDFFLAMRLDATCEELLKQGTAP